MALSHLDSLGTAHPELAEDVAALRGFFEKKYWHELTEHLLKAVNKAAWDNEELLWSLYSGFVSHFQLKINLISLGKILLAVTGKCPVHEKAVALLKEVADLVKGQGNEEARLLLTSEVAVRKVQQSVDTGSDVPMREAKDLVEEATAYLKAREASRVNVELRAHVYYAEAVVAKAEGHYSEFYEKCLLYIAHTDTEVLPEQRQRQLATDLGVAALLGETVHNFGELIHHPILDSLRGDDAWLAELLRAFNVGSIDVYERLCNEKADAMRARIGEGKAEYLRQKIELMALLHLLFITPVHDRTLSFEEVHKKCKTKSLDEVEPLLLRALALGLIRGSIDEVSQTIGVTWVVSRALGKDEVAELSGQLKEWIKRVNAVHDETQRTLAQYENEA